MSLRDWLGDLFGITPKMKFQGRTSSPAHRIEKHLAGMEVSESWDDAVALPDLERDADGQVTFEARLALDRTPLDGVFDQRMALGVRPRVQAPKQVLRPLRRTGHPDRPDSDYQQEKQQRLQPAQESRQKRQEIAGQTWGPDGITLGDPDA